MNQITKESHEEPEKSVEDPMNESKDEPVNAEDSSNRKMGTISELCKNGKFAEYLTFADLYNTITACDIASEVLQCIDCDPKEMESHYDGVGEMELIDLYNKAKSLIETIDHILIDHPKDRIIMMDLIRGIRAENADDFHRIFPDEPPL